MTASSTPPPTSPTPAATPPSPRRLHRQRRGPRPQRHVAPRRPDLVWRIVAGNPDRDLPVVLAALAAGRDRLRLRNREEKKTVASS